jgi:hypothetical protein
MEYKREIKLVSGLLRPMKGNIFMQYQINLLSAGFKNTFFIRQNTSFGRKLTAMTLQIAIPFQWHPLQSMTRQKILT